MTKTKTQIKTVKIKECVPNSWNPNEMNARQFSAVFRLTRRGATAYILRRDRGLIIFEIL